MNKTKVVVTIGPITVDKNRIKELIKNGADVIRLNMSYATRDFCTDVITKVRELNEELDSNVGIMLDLNGPVIRCGKLMGGMATYKTGDKIRIYMDNIIGDNTKFSVDYDRLVNVVRVDDIIKLQDGLVELSVYDKGEDYLVCEVLKGGNVYEYKNIIIPNIKTNIPFLRVDDIKNIEYANYMNVDYLALSHVRDSDDVLEVTDMLIEAGNDHIEVISKIECEEAVDNIDSIIKMSNGIMLDRTNLSFDLPMERIPAIQKILISKCQRTGKVSIITTDFESTDDVPSRAEVSDIVNAVLDGVDAISLADEIAIGKNPIKTLKVVQSVISEAELDIDYERLNDEAFRTEDEDITGMIACNVATTAHKLHCKAIIIPTISGYTARKISRFRPSCPIIAVSPNSNVVTSLSLHFGISAYLIDELKSLDSIIKVSSKIARRVMDINSGDKVIITGGYPFKETKNTNFMQIEEF